MFKVDLSLIADGGTLTAKDVTLTTAELGLGEPFTAKPALVSYELFYTFKKVYAKLQASAQTQLTCGRCLKDFDHAIAVDFMAQFEEKPEKATLHGADPEDPELNVAFFVDGEMRLGEEFRQELELQVPYLPLCKPNCAGLCPRCGADLNHGPCGCDLTPQNSPFAKLKGFIKED